MMSFLRFAILDMLLVWCGYYCLLNCFLDLVLDLLFCLLIYAWVGFSLMIVDFVLVGWRGYCLIRVGFCLLFRWVDFGCVGFVV